MKSETEKTSEKPKKKLVGIVSPPFLTSEASLHPSKFMYKGMTPEEFARVSSERFKSGEKKGHYASPEAIRKGMEKHMKGYSTNPHNIGNLKDSKIEEYDFNMTHFHQCGSSLYWNGCYSSDASFKRFITPESFAHPAKMSFLLCEKIFRHLKELGLLKKGDTICDFMAGSGRTNIMASLHGFDSVAVELEPHFTKMIKDNVALAKKKINRDVSVEVIQGDSRKLSELLNQKGLIGITSPPYTQEREGGGLNINPPNSFRGVLKNHSFKEGTSEGQIGNLPDKALVGVVSPPFLEQNRSGLKGMKERTDSLAKRLVAEREKVDFCGAGAAGKQYSLNPSNIGNLKDNRLVGITSPPYEESLPLNAKNYEGFEHVGSVKHGQHINKYNVENPENLGNQQGDSYLLAMLQVYQEAYNSGISPLVTVTKNPTRAGKLRRLDIDTSKLLMMAGYKIIDYHRSILFGFQKQATLTGEVKKKPKGRLSFFKRLSLQKGNVVAEYEDIIIAVIL